MCDLLKKIDPEQEPVITDDQWDAIGALIPCLGLEKEFEVSSSRGRRCLWDREEDRPLDREWSIRHLAGCIDRPLASYGLTTEQVKALQALLMKS